MAASDNGIVRYMCCGHRCPSYQERAVKNVLASAEADKEQKYSKAVEACRASFTPFVLPVDGVLGCEARAFVKRLAE